MPVDAATRRFNHSSRESSEPALAEVSVCIVATCAHLEPTPNEPGKHKLSQAGTTAAAPRLEPTTARAVERRVGTARACVSALE